MPKCMFLLIFHWIARDWIDISNMFCATYFFCTFDIDQSHCFLSLILPAAADGNFGDSWAVQGCSWVNDVDAISKLTILPSQSISTSQPEGEHVAPNQGITLAVGKPLAADEQSVQHSPAASSRTRGKSLEKQFSGMSFFVFSTSALFLTCPLIWTTDVLCVNNSFVRECTEKLKFILWLNQRLLDKSQAANVAFNWFWKVVAQETCIAHKVVNLSYCKGCSCFKCGENLFSFQEWGKETRGNKF